jgi:hypothetical protein
LEYGGNGVPRCILVLIDGLRADVAEARLAAGELPHMAEMLEGGGQTRAITAFPSTTSVAYLPFLTGCTPGHCNVPSIRWLDRTAYQGHWWRDRDAVRSYCGYQAPLLDRDIAPEVRTIFELAPESVGIFTPVARGLTTGRDPSRGERKFWGAVGHYALWHQPSDDVVGRHLLRSIDGPWKFVFAQFPAVDGYGHQAGPDSAPVHRALRRVDRVIGAVRERLRVRGELESTLILVVSDHGATPVHTHLDLPEWFREHSIPTLSHPVVWERAPRAAVMVAGNGSAMVYARPAERRERRWPVERLRQPDAFGSGDDLVTRLLAEPGVALVAGESAEGGVWVGARDGAALLRRDGRCISYEPLTGDPLAVGRSWGGSHREWLLAAWDARFPDAAYQLLDQFRSGRTGDLVVIANEGYDFRGRFEIPEHRAGHGSLFRAHMHSPLWTSHTLPRGPLRTIDLFPAMTDWLGIPTPAGIDGEAVWLPRRGVV